MYGHGATTGSAVPWPGLARLFLFMTTSQLIRRIVGLDRKAAKEAFAAFLAEGALLSFTKVG
jgi:hypothetical protein